MSEPASETPEQRGDHLLRELFRVIMLAALLAVKSPSDDPHDQKLASGLASENHLLAVKSPSDDPHDLDPLADRFVALMIELLSCD